MGARSLQPDVRAALEGAVVEGCVVCFAGQLDRATFVAAAKVLTTLGGRYRAGNTKGYVFDHDPTEEIARVLAGGSASVCVAEGFVETPDHVADDLCELAGIAALPRGARVLEPSAGAGAIVRAIHRAGQDVRVLAVEPNAGRAASIGLEGWPLTIIPLSFEAFSKAYAAGAAGAASDPRFDAVVMNPPFSTPENRTIWIDHVDLAWSLLKPGARLASVVPAGFGYRTDAGHERMRRFADGHRVLPDGTFSGGVRAVVMWAVKP